MHEAHPEPSSGRGRLEAVKEAPEEGSDVRARTSACCSCVWRSAPICRPQRELDRVRRVSRGRGRIDEASLLAHACSKCEVAHACSRALGELQSDFAPQARRTCRLPLDPVLKRAGEDMIYLSRQRPRHVMANTTMAPSTIAIRSNAGRTLALLYSHVSQWPSKYVIKSSLSQTGFCRMFEKYLAGLRAWKRQTLTAQPPAEVGSNMATHPHSSQQISAKRMPEANTPASNNHAEHGTCEAPAFVWGGGHDC